MTIARPRLMMQTMARWWSASLVVAVLAAQDAAIPDDIRRFIDIQHKVRLSLEAQPNHACRMIVRRARIGKKACDRELKLARKSGEERFEATLPPDLTDTVELEVAVIDGKELYAFPGSPRFEERGLSAIVGFGTIGTGDFNTHARSIFINSNARTEYVGREDLGGRAALRWDYEVSLFRSGYTISNAGGSAKVAYRGSFWADSETHELLRLTVVAQDIPPSLGVTEAVNEIDYQRVNLDGANFVTPGLAKLKMLLGWGAESVNETEFLDYKDFTAESTLSFDDGTETF